MKKIILLLFLLSSIGLIAQEEGQNLYILMEFMHVEDHNQSEYWEVEEFWSKIHQQRVADNNIVGWDLWQMSPGGKEQGSQFFTATLFSSLAAMLEGIPHGKFREYVSKAHPDLSEEEIGEMFKKTAHSRDIAHQVYCKQINTTAGSYEMKVGTVIVFDIMKQLHKSYEKMEDELFKPWHQKMVDEDKKESWGLMKVLLPAGSESKGTHLTYSMFSDYKQLAGFKEDSGGEMDLMTGLAVKEGLKTRDMLGIEMARLVKMVR